MQPKAEYKITKEEHHWTSDEKLRFCGYGEWVEESDVVEIEYIGYQALIMRVLKREPFCEEEAYFGGHLCGYIRIPDDHPHYGKDFRDLGLDCHGGITFNEIHEQHWMGFDCSHMGDQVPTMKKLNIDLPELRIMQEIRSNLGIVGLLAPVYRNMYFCIQECTSIIDQLIYIASHVIVKKTPWPIKE